MKEIIEEAKKFALEETKKTGTPPFEFLEITNKKGQEIADILNLDKNIVMLGTLLMDIKLGECLLKGKGMDHVKESSIATKEFLNKFKLDKIIKNKIINCVEAHHGEIDFICKEAEVCANADAYRFLHPRGVFKYFMLLMERNISLDEAIDQVEKKMEEKYNIISLDVVKKELNPFYRQFKKLITESRNLK